MPILPIEKPYFYLPNNNLNEKPTAKNHLSKLTIEQFFAYQAKNPNQRIELIDGQIVAMAGGSAGHSKIASRIISRIDDYLEQQHPHCHAFGSDFAIQTKPNQLRYPDFSVVCHVADDAVFSPSPVLVGEVLSEKSTANRDRQEKLQEYKQVASVQEIVLVSQLEKKVIVHRRGRSIFGWSAVDYTQGKVLFESIEVAIDIDDIYRRLNLG